MKSKTKREVKRNWISWKWVAGQAGYLKLTKNKVHRTESVMNGSVVLDKDKQGNIIGIEILPF